MSSGPTGIRTRNFALQKRRDPVVTIGPWLTRLELNQRPPTYQIGVLPTELRVRAGIRVRTGDLSLEDSCVTNYAIPACIFPTVGGKAAGGVSNLSDAAFDGRINTHGEQISYWIEIPVCHRAHLLRVFHLLHQ